MLYQLSYLSRVAKGVPSQARAALIDTRGREAVRRRHLPRTLLYPEFRSSSTGLRGPAICEKRVPSAADAATALPEGFAAARDRRPSGLRGTRTEAASRSAALASKSKCRRRCGAGSSRGRSGSAATGHRAMRNAPRARAALPSREH